MIPIKYFRSIKLDKQTEKRLEYTPNAPFTFGEFATDPEVYFDYVDLFTLIFSVLLAGYSLLL